MVCEYNPQHECQENQSSFPATTSDIMVNANLENVLGGTTIGVQWSYQEGELARSVDIADTTFPKSDESITSMYAILRRPDNGWPQGKYEVVLTSDESNVEPVRQDFSIAASRSSNATRSTSSVSAVGSSDTASLDSGLSESLISSESDSGTLLGTVTFCQLDDQGDCLTEMVLLPTTRPGVRVKANVSTAPIGTTVEARWRYVEGSLGGAEDIQTISMTKKDDKQTWVQSSLTKPEQGWPTGQYEVALRVVSNSSDIQVKRFFVQ